jgi:hypothetical protein
VCAGAGADYSREVAFGPLMPLTVDPDLLSGTLIGYQQKGQEINARMAELRQLRDRRNPKAAFSSRPRQRASTSPTHRQIGVT